MKNVYSLNCVYDSRNSFYGKANVSIDNEGTKDLYSYDTKVATITNINGVKTLEVYNMQSPTTLRHVKEFMQQNGYDKLTKSEIEDKYYV